MPNPRSKFVNHVRTTKPMKPADVGYDLRLLSDGDECAFRNVYDVLVDDKSIGVVIKFPKHMKGRKRGARYWEVAHSMFEAQAVERMHNDPKLVALKRYAPTILWHEPKTGVIVMPKYKAVKNSEFFKVFLRTFTNMLVDLIPEMKYEFDDAARNFGLNRRGHYVLLDAGLLGDVK